MKIILILAALFACVLADDVEVLKSSSDVRPDGYSFVVETSDGTSRQEEGEVKDIGSEHPSLAVHGTFSFKAKDDKVYTVSYVADEHGFQPVGEHIPTLPKN